MKINKANQSQLCYISPFIAIAFKTADILAWHPYKDRRNERKDFEGKMHIRMTTKQTQKEG